MANYDKFTRADMGLFAHCERKKDENGNYVTFGNQRIDPTRTHLNYNLCSDNREQKDILEARLSDPNIKCMNRANVNVFGSWCVTLPTQAPDLDENGAIIYEEKEVHHRDGTVTVENVPRLHDVFYTEEQTKEYFRLSYDFLSDRYGTENVISAYVHKDETTDHMHFLFVPLVEDKKWNEKHPDKPPRKKVCSKALMNKTELNRFHREFQEYLDEHSEKDLYPVLNGTTIGGARTIAEMKAESALEDAIIAAGQANTTKKLAEEEIARIDKEVETVQRDAREYIETLHQREDDALKEVMNEFDKWAKSEEQKEISSVQEIKRSLADLGATAEHEQPLSVFAEKLKNPVTGKNGRTYVEVPAPKVLLPLLKKVVQKMLGAFGWAHDAQKRVAEHVEHARTSFKEILPQKKREADQQNEERWAVERQQQAQAHKKNEQSL